jgi:SAM-dependent methyltransferase
MISQPTPHKEPEELFQALSQTRYAEFYALEMDTHNKDIAFYHHHCKKKSRILELGCGTGRISRALSGDKRFLLGLDLSLPMLQQCARAPQTSFPCVCMDMTAMAFRKDFDHILIPHNTLNLLRSDTLIAACLQQSAALLNKHGSLLLQIHIPDRELIAAANKRIFQFQMFDLPGRQGKLIKETLRSYSKKTAEIHLEERYRLRPVPAPKIRQDFRQNLILAGFSLDKWIRLFKDNGFPHLSLFGTNAMRSFKPGHDSSMFVCAKINI